MVDGPGDDIRAQLAALLGKPLARIGQVRKTDETPPRVSVIDVICAVMGLNGNNAAMTFARLKDEHPDLTTICGQVKFTDCKEPPKCSGNSCIRKIQLSLPIII